jgi:hypothetical protein
VTVGFVDMERAMRATGWSESCVRRVVVIGGTTAAVMIALVFSKPFYSATTATALSGADVSQGVAVQEPATETESIVPHPRLKLILSSSSAAVTEAADITPNHRSSRWP